MSVSTAHLSAIRPIGLIRSHSSAITFLGLAIPIALETIRLVSKAVAYYRTNIASRPKHVTFLSALFKDFDFKRIAKFAVVAAVAVLGAYYLSQCKLVISAANVVWTATKSTSVVQYILRMKAEWQANVWTPPFLPADTKLNVYGGYSLLGTGHAIQAYRSHKDKSTLRTIMHVVMAAIGFATPIAMELGLTSPRWHHSTYGLICALPGFGALSIFGSAIALDSATYWFQNNPANYGMDNIFVENWKPFVAMLTLTTAVEVVSRWCSSSETAPDKDTPRV